MSVSLLMLLFAGFVLSSFVLLKQGHTLIENYWRYLVQGGELHLQHSEHFNATRKLASGYLISVLLIIVVLPMSGIGSGLIGLLLLLMLGIPSAVFRILRKRRLQQINSALPDALSQISAAMRAGSTFQTALQSQADNTDGALAQEFAIVLRECRVGVRLEEALENLAERTESEEIDLLVSAAIIAQDVGGNLSEALHGLSHTIRRKIDMEGKIESLTAQGRLQGYVVTALPMIMLLGLSVIEPETTLPIFSSLLGWIVLSIMFALQIAGGLMIRKIVSIDI